MPEQTEFRTIPFEDQKAIRAAIQNREDFEVEGCKKRMKEAVEFVEHAIDSEGMTSRIYTKGRSAALAAGAFVPGVGVAIAGGIAAHNLTTQNPDYEVMKRPIAMALRLTYRKDAPTIGAKLATIKEAARRQLDGLGDYAAETAKTATTSAANTTQKVSSSAANKIGSLATKSSELTPDVVKTTANRVSEGLDVISGVKLLEIVQETLELQEKYNDVLAGKLEEALLRIADLENAIQQAEAKS